MRIQCCLNFNIKYSMPFKIQNIMALICFHINAGVAVDDVINMQCLRGLGGQDGRLSGGTCL